MNHRQHTIYIHRNFLTGGSHCVSVFPLTEKFLFSFWFTPVLRALIKYICKVKKIYSNVTELMTKYFVYWFLILCDEWNILCTDFLYCVMSENLCTNVQYYVMSETFMYKFLVLCDEWNFRSWFLYHVMSDFQYCVSLFKWIFHCR